MYSIVARTRNVLTQPCASDEMFDVSCNLFRFIYINLTSKRSIARRTSK